MISEQRLRAILEEGLHSLDRSHLHHDDQIHELRSRTDTLAEMFRKILEGL